MNAHQQRSANAQSLPHLNDAFRALHLAMEGSTPRDFEWWMTFSRAEVFAGWTWDGDPERSLQREVRADSFALFLDKWYAVDWRAERIQAKENARSEVHT